MKGEYCILGLVAKVPDDVPTLTIRPNYIKPISQRRSFPIKFHSRRSVGRARDIKRGGKNESRQSRIELPINFNCVSSTLMN
jgi:hypothetical protein